jgi:hypothetical protein
MNLVARIKNRGRSCFIAELIRSKSFVAISKSCSSYNGCKPDYSLHEVEQTLNKFFSSLKLLSFFSLSLVNELLNLS